MTGLFLVTGEASTSDLRWAHARSLQVQRHPISAGPYLPAAARSGGALKFSLSFFANDEDAMTGPKYRLLLEAARLADAEGLHAIWFPERHFHSFGGLYPSPTAIGAALATATERVALRAGSVVLPLHDPVRVAEEWAVIDNLSGGRAGISFASGWHADDFVLAPGRYADRRETMAEGIDIVRRLWRGEPIERTNGVGRRSRWPSGPGRSRPSCLSGSPPRVTRRPSVRRVARAPPCLPTSWDTRSTTLRPKWTHIGGHGRDRGAAR